MTSGLSNGGQPFVRGGYATVRVLHLSIRSTEVWTALRPRHPLALLFLLCFVPSQLGWPGLPRWPYLYLCFFSELPPLFLLRSFVGHRDFPLATSPSSFFLIQSFDTLQGSACLRTHYTHLRNVPGSSNLRAYNSITAISHNSQCNNVVFGSPSTCSKPSGWHIRSDFVELWKYQRL